MYLLLLLLDMLQNLLFLLVGIGKFKNRNQFAFSSFALLLILRIDFMCAYKLFLILYSLCIKITSTLYVFVEMPHRIVIGTKGLLPCLKLIMLQF